MTNCYFCNSDLCDNGLDAHNHNTNGLLCADKFCKFCNINFSKTNNFAAAQVDNLCDDILIFSIISNFDSSFYYFFYNFDDMNLSIVHNIGRTRFNVISTCKIQCIENLNELKRIIRRMAKVSFV